MRSNRIVVLTPLLDEALGVRQGDEPVLDEAFVTETTVEAFDECVL